MRLLPTAALLQWFRGARRDLPWRHQRTPWRVWVAETMLQQTTVAVVARRFPEFVAQFPDPAALAAASEAEVVQAWAGLGYYRRARALRAAAIQVQALYQGAIPEDQHLLRALPGVGEYTAAAIRALAFNRRAAAVDANVARVLARWMATDHPMHSVVFRRGAAQVILDSSPSRGREFSEALIELGALVCRAQEAECHKCPLAQSCAAHARGPVSNIPKSGSRKTPLLLDSVRLLIRRGSRLALVQRPTAASLLPGQWELPGAWFPRSENPAAEFVGGMLAPLGLRMLGDATERSRANHSITTHRLRCRLFEVEAVGRLRGAVLVDPKAPQRTITTESVKLLRAGGCL